MSESIRSFLAFDIESELVTNRLATAQRLLVQTGADLKIVEPENIHLTVRFLGDVSLPLVEKIYEIMKNVQFSAFEVHINGIGAFPDLHYPRVVWAGIARGADQLKNIFSQLEPQLQSAGFTPDTKGFNPHLTIARVRSGKNRQQLGVSLSNSANYDFGIVKARCLRLKRSILTHRGPIYSTLKEFCPLL